MPLHLRILGWLYTVIGVIGVIACSVFIYMIYGKGPYAYSPEMQRLLIEAGLGSWMLGVATIASIFSLIAGLALLKMQSWARKLLMTFGILSLVDFPIGTIIGVYTIWVLWRHKTLSTKSGE
ncbi:MAG: hypothetical protein WCG83_02450 [Candidatus Peregrinibacteria bacterium]